MQSYSILMSTASKQSKEQRRARILQMLESAPIPNQAELRLRLAREGWDVNQGTLSRDLRDIGAAKGPGGYTLPVHGSPEIRDPKAGLLAASRQWLTSATPAQNQVVIRCLTGGAQPLALAVDRADLSDLLGTVAGDDCILAILPDTRKARAFAAFMEGLAG